MHTIYCVTISLSLSLSPPLFRMTSVCLSWFESGYRYLTWRGDKALSSGQPLQMRALIPFAFPRANDTSDPDALKNMWYVTFYIFVHIYLYIYIYLYIQIFLHIQIFLYAHVFYVYKYSIYIYIYVCMCIHLCIYIYICILDCITWKIVCQSHTACFFFYLFFFHCFLFFLIYIISLIFWYGIWPRCFLSLELPVNFALHEPVERLQSAKRIMDVLKSSPEAYEKNCFPQFFYCFCWNGGQDGGVGYSGCVWLIGGGEGILFSLSGLFSSFLSSSSASCTSSKLFFFFERFLGIGGGTFFLLFFA